MKNYNNISMIAAVGDNGMIGSSGTMPWHLPADLRYFKATTMGHHIIMGRKTFESVGKALPGRPNLVVSRQLGYQAQGCNVFGSLDEAIAFAKNAGDDEVFVTGGAQLYTQAMSQATRLYITEIDESFEGDTRFPEFQRGRWIEVSRQSHEPDERNRYRYAFVVYERDLEK